METPLVMRWSDQEVEKLRAFYSLATLELEKAAKSLGRTADSVCQKAAELGLTNVCRPKLPQLALNFETPLPKEELSKRISERNKKWFSENEHPRGMLGKKHSPEVLARVSSASVESWKNPNSKVNSDAFRQGLSDRMIARVVARTSFRGHTRTKGGRRQDLGGVYFRSGWEANYARYLNILVERGEILSWEYEPMVFVFEAIKRGTRTYTPDFLVKQKDGLHEWHEVKGWMDQPSATRLKRMAKYFPDEKVIVRDSKFFKWLRASPVRGLIVNWE
jgi:hypothetical protein